LNASISTLEKKGLGRLEEYHAEWTEMSDVLTASVANVEFEGISVCVSSATMFLAYCHLIGYCTIGKGVIS